MAVIFDETILFFTKIEPHYSFYWSFLKIFLSFSFFGPIKISSFSGAVESHYH